MKLQTLHNMPFILSNEDEFSLTQSLDCILDNDPTQFFSLERIDELISSVGSLDQPKSLLDPRLEHIYLIAHVNKPEDIELIRKTVSMFQTKLDNDKRTEARLALFPILCFGSAAHLRSCPKSELLPSVTLRIPGVFIILDCYVNQEGREVPLDKKERRSQLVNIIVLNEQDRNFAADLCRGSLCWVALLKSQLYSNTYLGQKRYQEVIRSIQEKLFGNETISYPLDEDETVKYEGDEHFKLAAKTFVRQSRLRVDLKALASGSFIRDYGEEFVDRAYADLSSFFSDHAMERPRHIVIEKLENALRKVPDLKFFKDGLAAWLEELSRKAKDSIPLETIFANFVEEVKQKFLSPLSAQVAQVRKKLLRRLRFALFSILLLVGLLGFSLKTGSFSVFSILIIAAAVLLYDTVLISISRIEMRRLNSFIEKLEQCVRAVEEKRNSSISSELAAQGIAFLKGLGEYASDIYEVFKTEAEADLALGPTRFLEIVGSDWAAENGESIKRNIKMLVLNRVYEVWCEDAKSFGKYYEKIKREYTEILATEMEKRSVPLLGEHFNNYEMLNNFISSFPAACVQNCEPEKVPCLHRAKTILAISSDLILSADRIVGRYEYRKLNGLKTIIYAHFIPMSSG